MGVPRLLQARHLMVVAGLMGAQWLFGCRGDALPPGDSLSDLLETAPLLDVQQVGVFGLGGGIGDALMSPQFVGTDEEGYVYVHDPADRGTTELKRFAPTGEFDRLVVRAGDGPFSWLEMWPPALWVESTDSIVIWNHATKEILVFDVNGTMRSRTSWTRIAGDFDALLPSGRYGGEFLTLAMRDELIGGMRASHYAAYLRVGGDGAVLDTVWSQRRPGDWIQVDLGGGVSTRASVLSLPHRYGYAVPFGHGGLLEVQAAEPRSWDSGTLTLTALGGSGPARSRTLAYRPLSLPVREIRKGRLDDASRSWSRYPGRRSALRTLERNLDVPRFAPPFHIIHAFPDESVWCRLALTAEALLNPQRPVHQHEFLVISLDDRPPFRVVLPPHRLFAVDEKGTIWLTVATEAGEPYVASFVIRR